MCTQNTQHTIDIYYSSDRMHIKVQSEIDLPHWSLDIIRIHMLISTQIKRSTENFAEKRKKELCIYYMYNRIKTQKIDVANESFGSEFLIFRLYTAL